MSRPTLIDKRIAYLQTERVAGQPMSEAEELQFLAQGLRKASAFELECLTHGTIRISPAS